ncbi:MAG: radical SAM protein [Xanthobacteraceae bacterium]
MSGDGVSTSDLSDTFKKPSVDSSEVVLYWVILKIAQRCNLDCTYCYVYNRGDSSWKSRPAFVSDKVIKALAARVVEHCDAYHLDRFIIELHGGEPLLFGRRRMQALIDALRRDCPGIRIDFLLQTNGLLLDQDWLKFFAANDMRFGISCDGPEEFGDKRRIHKDGRGSTRQLLEIIRSLRDGSSLFDDLKPGFLCVVDPLADGRRVVRWFGEQQFRSFDLLLPDCTFANLPQGWVGAEPYRRFLLDAFEEWHSLGASAPRIRLFEQMLSAFLGVRPSMDYLGGDPRRLCVVESDGSMGLSDLMRICGGRYAEDELSVFDDRLDAIAPRHGLDFLQQPCATCQNCVYFDACRGGLLSHRFDGVSFDNPSVYCSVLYSLAAAAFDKWRAALPAHAVSPPSTGARL